TVSCSVGACTADATYGDWVPAQSDKTRAHMIRAPVRIQLAEANDFFMSFSKMLTKPVVAQLTCRSLWSSLGPPYGNQKSRVGRTIQMDSTTSAYSSTGPPAVAGCLLPSFPTFLTY